MFHQDHDLKSLETGALIAKRIIMSYKIKNTTIINEATGPQLPSLHKIDNAYIETDSCFFDSSAVPYVNMNNAQEALDWLFANRLTAGNAITISNNKINGAYRAGTGVTISGDTISGNYVAGPGIVISGNTVSVEQSIIDCCNTPCPPPTTPPSTSGPSPTDAPCVNPPVYTHSGIGSYQPRTTYVLNNGSRRTNRLVLINQPTEAISRTIANEYVSIQNRKPELGGLNYWRGVYYATNESNMLSLLRAELRADGFSVTQTLTCCQANDVTCTDSTNPSSCGNPPEMVGDLGTFHQRATYVYSKIGVQKNQFILRTTSNSTVQQISNIYQSITKGMPDMGGVAYWLGAINATSYAAQEAALRAQMDYKVSRDGTVIESLTYCQTIQRGL